MNYINGPLPPEQLVGALHDRPVVMTTNDRGEWVPAIPVPFYGLRKRCECGSRFWTEARYRAHYALVHILGPPVMSVPQAAITALPWEDPFERGPGHPNWGATCDWGDCDNATVTMRWDDRLKQWLPVCALHAPTRISRCAALPPDHEAWECE